MQEKVQPTYQNEFQTAAAATLEKRGEFWQKTEEVWVCFGCCFGCVVFWFGVVPMSGM